MSNSKLPSGLTSTSRNVPSSLVSATRAASGVFYGTVSIGFSGAPNHRTLPPLTAKAASAPSGGGRVGAEIWSTGRGEERGARRRAEELTLDLGSYCAD